MHLLCNSSRAAQRLALICRHTQGTQLAGIKHSRLLLSAINKLQQLDRTTTYLDHLSYSCSCTQATHSRQEIAESAGAWLT
jgi:hypothetical protein